MANIIPIIMPLIQPFLESPALAETMPHLAGYWTARAGNFAKEQTVLDSSGNGNHGTAKNQNHWVRGEGGIFVPETEDHVEVPDDNSLDMGTKDISCFAWVNVQKKSGGRILSKESDNDGWFLNVNTDGDFRPGFKSGGTTENLTGDKNSVTFNEWAFLAWIVDRDGNQASYVNGVEEYTSDISSYKNTSVAVENNLYMGGRVTTSDLFIDALTDELMIFKNVVFTDNQQWALYNITRPWVLGR